MTYDQYWNGSPELVRYYYRAHQLKLDEQNFFAHLYGFYNYAAFSAVISNFSAGLAGKQGQEKYIEKPIKIRELTEEEEQAEIMEKRRKFVAALNRFHATHGGKDAC